MVTEQRVLYTIDTILEEAGLNDTPFAIIKFDIQGAELKALRGASRVLQRGRPLVIVEVSILPFNGNQAPSFFAIHTYMEQIGFKFADILGYHYATGVDFKKLLQIDAAFVRSEFVCWPTTTGTCIGWES